MRSCSNPSDATPTGHRGSRRPARLPRFSGRLPEAAATRSLGRPRSPDKSCSSNPGFVWSGWRPTTALIAPPLALAQALMLVPAVGLTLGGALIARTYRAANERVQIALEQVLDRLERGEIRTASSPAALPGADTLVRIAEEVRKAFENPRPKARG